jgi:hypothetical protein
MTRRELLRAVGVALRGAIALVFPACARREPARPGPSTRPLDTPSSTATLPASEMENLVALTEVLVQGKPLSPFERGALVEAINERSLSNPGHLSLYRFTASFLDQLGQTRFADLSLADRTEVVLRHRLGPDSSREVSSRPLPPSEPEDVVRRVGVPELIGCYYRSRAGWAVVAYESFPGRCSDLLRYTRPD